MGYTLIAKGFSVSPQISASEVKAIADAGFKSIICNRPDAEQGAIPHGQIEAQAKAAGLEFRYIPVISGGLTRENAVDMAAALRELPQPVLAYCRSGARSSNLYMVAQQVG
ncbi:MAG: TIGR01244 family phosphatase [Nitratireductor sp.]|nr:TIGR01244 family phosphatase [Nitratireductor sp.]